MANVLYDALFAPHQSNTSTFLHLKDGGTLTYEAFLRLAAQ